jgi:ferredoxin
MITARRFATLRPIHTTNFIPQLQEGTCKECGKCVTSCPVEAMTSVSAHDPHHPKKKKARLNPEICLGCGVCARICLTGSIQLQPRSRRVITPQNYLHRTVMMAIERGTLQYLIFDNRVLWGHRALAAMLEVILKLPLIKQIMASQQIKCRYLEILLDRWNVQDLCNQAPKTNPLFYPQ